MLNIKYDIVGSFLRPEPIKKARAEYAQGKITLEKLRKVEDAAIAGSGVQGSGPWPEDRDRR